MKPDVKREPTFGDSVRVLLIAPAKWMPGSIGSVVSVYEVTTEGYSQKHSVPVGSIMIGIEEDDGTFFEVPREYVEFLS